MRWLATFVALYLGLYAVLLAAICGVTDLLSGQGVMGLHGWIARDLGIVLTSALGIGLIGLVFYSHRSHKDDDIR